MNTLYSQDGEIELGLVNKEHTNAYRKKSQASINRGNRAIYSIKTILWKAIFYDMKLNNNKNNNNNINNNMKNNSENNDDVTQKENFSRYVIKSN